MIVSGYSGIAAFAALLRIALGVLLIAVAVRALRRREESDSRYYLGFVMGATLFGVAVAAWPLFYLVLQSYVGLWPGVMCIDGVVGIGAGSANAASHLPSLVAFLQVSKPALVFVAGVSLVFHFALRNRSGARLRRGVIATFLLLGVLGLSDGAAESAYLFIPKQEQVLATGCCTVGSEADAFAPVGSDRDRSGSGDSVPLTAAFFGMSLLVVAAIAASQYRMRASGRPGRGLAIACLGAIALLPLGTSYLRDVGAPLFLRLPYHRCPYCLVGYAPEALVGVALFGLALLAVGWAVVARRLDGAGISIAAPLLRFARFGLMATLLMIAVRMVTA